MTGGTLNLISEGTESKILVGQPQKHFLKKHIYHIQILDNKNLE